MDRLGAAAGALLTALAGLLLMSMMALTVVDVVGRYLFSAPLTGAYEATEVMLALSIFAGLPLVTARGEHIAVTLVSDHLPRRFGWGLARVIDVVVAAVLAGAAFVLFQRATALSRYGDTTQFLAIPMGPVAMALAAFTALAAAAAAVRAVSLVVRAPDRARRDLPHPDLPRADLARADGAGSEFTGPDEDGRARS